MANFQTFQLLTDILGILKEANNDPNAIKKWASEAYRLNAEGEAKLANAPKIIAESEKIEADQAKKQAELDSLGQELSKKEAALETRIGKQLSEADEADKKLKSRESAVAAREAAVRNGMDDIANRESELQRHINAHMINLKSHAEKVSDLDAREEAIATKEAEAEAMKKRLQDYAAKLKAHAEGIVL